MTSRLSSFLQSVAAGAARAVEGDDEDSDARVTLAPPNVTASSATVTEGSSGPEQSMTAYPEAEVAQVAVFPLPSPVEKSKKMVASTQNLFPVVKGSKEIPATSATSPASIDVAAVPHEDQDSVDLSDEATGGTPAQSPPIVRAVPAVTPQKPIAAPFTHLTASGTSLHDLELGHIVALPATLPVCFFRALFEARAAGALASSNQKCQQQMWDAIRAGYLVAWIQNRFYRVSPVSLNSQFVTVSDNTKGHQTCQ